MRAMAAPCERCSSSPCACCSVSGCNAPAPPTKVKEGGKEAGKYHHGCCSGIPWARQAAKVARAFAAASKEVRDECRAAKVYKLKDRREENKAAVEAKAHELLKADFPDGKGARVWPSLRPGPWPGLTRTWWLQAT